MSDTHPRFDVDGLTLPDIVDQAAERSDVEALVFPDERVTYGELRERSIGLAGNLRALGVEPGDHVAYLMAGGVDILVVMLGILRLGAVAVPINARYKAAEITGVLADADVRVVIAEQLYLKEVLVATEDPAAVPALRHIVGGEPDLPGGEPDRPGGKPRRPQVLPWSTFLSRSVADDLPAVDHDALAMILFTSGTTSRPKGVMHSQATILNSSASLAERLELMPDDRFWSPLPLFHIAAIAATGAAFVAGCTLVHVGFFDPGVALRQLEEERCTLAFPSFETIWLAVLDHPDFATTDLSTVERIINIGTPERLRAMQERVPDAVQVSGTGSTESGGFLAVGVVTDTIEERTQTNGHVLPGMEVRLLDPVSGEVLQPPARGELLYRGPSRLLGYYGDPAITAERIDPDGWFHSGDLCRLDADGRITFVERLKDMLKVGGENVAAAEIEDHLAGHPDVRMVQVVAAPDARYVEVPCAFVQRVDGSTVTEQDLIDFCRGQIATFKVPRYVRFTEDFPMSGTKVQKYKLRERIRRELEEAGITEAPRITSA